MDRADAKTIPIIALTANAFDEDVQRSLQAGMNAHLTKPVEPNSLYQALIDSVTIRVNVDNDSKKVTVYDTVEKEIKKDLPSRLHARRQMLKVLYPVTDVPKEGAKRKQNTKKVDLPQKLFDEIAPKYADRKGGYTRIVKIGPRRGDAAMEVLLELV